VPVAQLDFGGIGVVVNPGRGDAFLGAVAELEGLGYAAIWVTGGPLEDLQQLADVVRATREIRVGSAILSVDRFPSADVAGLYAELETTDPGRFIVGLGGAHGAKPLDTLATYLDELDAVPPPRRVLAALGPRMLDFVHGRAAGALPVLVTPEYTADARTRLGDETSLVVEQLVVLEADATRARQIARGPLGFMGTLPAYQANFRRMGFSDDEIAQRADRLVDGLIACGDIDAVAGRIAQHQRAGADHVAVNVIADSPDELPIDKWRSLAATLVAEAP
jgi:probable F420-dependent oxidoreductase